MMKNRFRRFFTGILAAVSVLFAVPVFVMADTPSATITIFHTNDMHGHLLDTYNSAKQLKTIGSDYIAAIKKSVPGAILVDAGDASQGVPFANISKGADVIALTNAAGYDIGILGNHEFDYGLTAMFANVRSSVYPTLSANTMYNGAPILKNMNGNGLTGNNGCDLIKTINGIKVGFFGITTPETAYKTNPSYLKDATSSVTFLDPVTISQQEIDKLKKEGAQVIIGIMHIGDDPMSSPNSVDIAKKVTGLNVLIDGHSHTIENSIVNSTLIAQTGCYSGALGRIDITVAPDGTVTAKESLITPAEAQKSYTPDPVVATLAAKLNEKQAALFGEVVGHTSTVLWGGVVDGISVTRLGECNLGDLVADAMADSARKHIEGTANAGLSVVALENGGGVRDSISAGDITQGQVSTVLPFGNIISMKEVTPAVLYEILENGVSKIAGQDTTTGEITGANGRFPQISGMRFTYDPNGTPYSETSKGTRVKQIVLVNPDGSDGKTLSRSDTDTRIVLATNDYENSGGDGYTMLAAIKNIGEGNALDSITADYISNLTAQGNGSFAYPNSLGRIRVDTEYIYKNYNTSITLTDKNGIVSNSRILYTVDNMSAAWGSTDENGTFPVPDLIPGTHTIYVYKDGEYTAVYVNNTIAKTTAKSDMTLQTNDQKAAAAMMQTILTLPETVTAKDSEAVKAALKSFNNLTAAQKELVANAAVLQKDTKILSLSKAAGIRYSISFRNISIRSTHRFSAHTGYPLTEAAYKNRFCVNS